MAYRDGFSVLEGFLVVGVIAIISAVGYLAYVNLWDHSTPSNTETSKVTSPVKVEDSKDLDKVDGALNDVSLDDSESTEFDQASGSF